MRSTSTSLRGGIAEAISFQLGLMSGLFCISRFFRYLDCLKELPPALKTEKFEGLLPFAELARFNKKELKRYRYIMHLKWDRYAQELAFAEDHPDFVKKIEDETVEKALKIVKRVLRKRNLSPNVIKECVEDLSVLKA